MGSKTQFFLALITLSSFAACRSNDKTAEGAAVAPLYEEYTISGEEGREAVTIRAQFKRGEKGGSLRLIEPAKVLFDGEVLSPDSVGKIGWFYEAQSRLDEFSGPHSFVFVDDKGAEQERTFDFPLFTLDSLTAVSRTGLQLGINGLPDNSSVHLIITDTSFASNDINAIDTVRNNELVVSADRLRNLKNGPVNLQIIFKQTQNIQKRGIAGGNLSSTYSLRRLLQLTD